MKANSPAHSTEHHADDGCPAEKVLAESGKGELVTGSLVVGEGKLGAEFPVDENPHHLVLF